jgi:hypothetical protein
MITAERRIELLSRVPLFSGVTKGTMRKLAALGRETIHEPGKAIVREGGTAHALHVMVEGTATIRVKDRVVGHLKPGDFFGEIALLDKGPRAATVSADSRVVTLAVEGTALRGTRAGRSASLGSRPGRFHPEGRRVDRPSGRGIRTAGCRRMSSTTASRRGRGRPTGIPSTSI